MAYQRTILLLHFMFVIEWGRKNLHEHVNFLPFQKSTTNIINKYLNQNKKAEVFRFKNFHRIEIWIELRLVSKSFAFHYKNQKYTRSLPWRYFRYTQHWITQIMMIQLQSEFKLRNIAIVRSLKRSTFPQTVDQTFIHIFHDCNLFNLHHYIHRQWEPSPNAAFSRDK